MSAVGSESCLVSLWFPNMSNTNWRLEISDLGRIGIVAI